MKRFEVWIDCEEDQEEEVRRKVESALNSLHLDYTVLTGSSELDKTKGTQR